MERERHSGPSVANDSARGYACQGTRKVLNTFSDLRNLSVESPEGRKVYFISLRGVLGRGRKVRDVPHGGARLGSERSRALSNSAQPSAHEICHGLDHAELVIGRDESSREPRLVEHHDRICSLEPVQVIRHGLRAAGDFLDVCVGGRDDKDRDVIRPRGDPLPD